MKNKNIRNKLLNILSFAPAIRDIFLSEEIIDEKRKKIRKTLAEILVATFEDDKTIPPLNGFWQGMP